MTGPLAAISSPSALDFIFSGAGPQHFGSPVEILAPHSFAAAWHALERVDAAHRDGYAIAGMIDFEFGYACCGLTPPNYIPQSTRPLMRIGIYEPDIGDAGASSFIVREMRNPQPALQFGQPGLHLESAISQARYEDAITQIGARLFAGDVYQVNYTVPFFGRTPEDIAHADAHRLFSAIGGASQAAYRAAVFFEGGSVVSISPELFLRMSRETLETRPMKGTAAPGSEALLLSEKNRAEHVMIVDLLRNDIARVCTQVDVPQLFSLERYPTFSTMTSTITGRRKSDAGFAEIMRALFPCGSVVGAPKIAALRTIGELEARARGAYCGTIGYLLPDGRGVWNVAIRTLQFDYARSEARVDLGGGIVADSTAADEWNELLVKSAFLRPFAEVA